MRICAAGSKFQSGQPTVRIGHVNEIIAIIQIFKKIAAICIGDGCIELCITAIYNTIVIDIKVQINCYTGNTGFTYIRVTICIFIKPNPVTDNPGSVKVEKIILNLTVCGPTLICKGCYSGFIRKETEAGKGAAVAQAVFGNCKANKSVPSCDSLADNHFTTVTEITVIVEIYPADQPGRGKRSSSGVIHGYLYCTAINAFIP